METKATDLGVGAIINSAKAGMTDERFAVFSAAFMLPCIKTVQDVSALVVLVSDHDAERYIARPTALKAMAALHKAGMSDADMFAAWGHRPHIGKQIGPSYMKRFYDPSIRRRFLQDMAAHYKRQRARQRRAAAKKTPAAISPPASLPAPAQTAPVSLWRRILAHLRGQ